MNKPQPVALEPCPLCARTDSEDNAIQEAAVHLRQVKSAIGGMAWQVECVCGARGPVCTSAIEAQARWNTRAVPASALEAVRREALTEDDATVERAARAMWEAHHLGAWDDKPTPGTMLTTDFDRQTYREHARAAIRALIGEKP